MTGISRALLRLLPVIAAVAMYFAMAIGGAAHNSATFDEGVHVTAGYSYWAFDDYRLHPGNGNWPQRLVALPSVLSRNPYPTLDQEAWHNSDVWRMSDQFFFGGHNDADAVLRHARMMVALIGALLGVLVFFWSRQLFGTAGGWVSLSLFVFSPTLLAQGALATSDLIGAAFFTAAAWALWTILHRVTPWTLACSGVATAGLFLSKHSAPIFIPIALGMVAVRLIAARPLVVHWGVKHFEIRARGSRAWAFLGLTVAHVMIVSVIIWASYGFRYQSMAAHTTPQDRPFEPWSLLISNPTVPARLAQWGREHHVLPEAYLYGLSTVAAHANDRTTFLNGVVRTGGGRAAFFPYAALVKTTLPELILLAAVPLMLAWRRRPDSTSEGVVGRAGLYDLTPLVLLIGVYWASAISSGVNIGYRHLLPVVPATIVLIGATGEPISRALRRREALIGRGKRTVAAAAIVIGLLIWHAVESGRIAPHYMAYFNPIAGGPERAYRHLVDSSLDWGQDLPGLKDWLDRHGLQDRGHPPVFLSYFGSARSEYYLIDAKPLPGYFDWWRPRVPEPLTGGVYCISATMLQGLYLMAPRAWTAEYETKYQSLVHDIEVLESTRRADSARAAVLQRMGSQYWLNAYRTLEQLRFARLASYLRKREPDAEVGYSILIYRLTDADVSRALFGPSP